MADNVNTVFALDISNYQGIPTKATIEHWLEWGVRHVIVRGSLERQELINIAKAQLRVLNEHKIPVSIYGWFYLSVYPGWSADRLVHTYEEFGPVSYWLDVEETEDYGNPSQNESWVAQWGTAMDRHGVKYGIYTGGWYWRPYLGNTTAFQDWPLWDANYGVSPSLGDPGYGGWRARTGHQYSAHSIDQNLFDAQFLEVEDMARINDLENLLGYLKGDVADALEQAIEDKKWAEVKNVLNTLRHAGEV